MQTEKKRLVILISGRGSNMSSLLEAAKNREINGEVVAVISNKASATGLDVAREAGIAAAVVDHKAYQSREDFDAALLAVVASYQPDLVILAGFMRILTPVFVRPLRGKLINIHPSLLPKYPGLHTHERAIAAGDREAGATAHFVTEELDGGPAIIQARVPILPEDTPETLAARVLEQEHKIYTEAVRLLCNNQVSYSESGYVQANGKILPQSGIIHIRA
ncbi:MAG: phosphoribosylglycinamide formyltransferase [Porticoccaceae bacterium]|nr:phosphoribosylglycinamide formyltransferase [Porticoccaceae bacterium]